jgi:hypothetical protein
MSSLALFTVILVATLHEIAAFSSCNHRIVSHPTVRSQLNDSYDDEFEQPKKQKKGFFANFFEELDAFVDDATSRRLGNGAQYYGKRKSSFYGENDVNKKKNSGVFDPAEDYRGPSNAGYFKWIQDPETGEMKPVTRLKEKVIEKKIY